MMTQPLESRTADYLITLSILQNENGRRALLFQAIANDPLQHQIIFNGPTVTFCQLLVQTLVTHGRLVDGRDPLIAMLEASKTLVGLESTRVADGLIEEWRRRIPPEPLPPAPPLPVASPFKGLQFFDVQDADLFFGREALTEQLVETVQQQHFLAVVGASGSGKSSLVRAGLVPMLRRQDISSADNSLSGNSLSGNSVAHWHIHIITPTARPLESLALSLTRHTQSIQATTNLLDALTNDMRSLHLHVRKWLEGEAVASATTHVRLLLVVDQFEELFTLCRDKTQRRLFVDNLMTAALAEGSTVLVIVLRADFYSPCLKFDNLRTQLESHQKIIGAMTRDELRRAIESPAQQHGYDFDAGLVDLLLDDIGALDHQQPEPGALPLLAHALLETWQRRQATRLTLAGYLASGGVSKAIANTATSLYNQLNDEEKILARHIFVGLTEVGDGTQDTRRRVTLAELPTQQDAVAPTMLVLNKLAAARLVTIDRDSIEVAHEALIREWPLLRTWLDESREALLVRRRLSEEAQGWQELRRDAGSLYRGVRLLQALEWAQAHGSALTQLEREFLATSQMMLGDDEWAEGSIKRAQTHLEQAIQLAPQLSTPYQHLYQLLVETDRFEDAYQVYQQMVQQTDAPLLLPTHYRIEAIIGKSEFGVVYRVWDEQGQQPVAITLAEPSPERPAQTIATLQQLFAQVQSPFISRFLALSRHQERYFIVNELVEGECLSNRLAADALLPGAEIFALLDQVAAALETAHAQGLSHLGLNPGNILLSGGRVKLTHFGEKHWVRELLESSNSGARYNHSPGLYLAPEQLTGAVVGVESDIYTFGTLIYHLFTGYPPGSGTRLPPSQVHPAADEALDLLIMRARESEPAERFATIIFLRSELQRIANVHRPGGVEQTLHWLFALATRTVIWLRQPPRRGIVMLIWVCALLLDLWLAPSLLRMVLRFSVLAALSGYMVAAFFRWQMRSMAVDSGRISLIQSGQGMGAIFGTLLVFWCVRVVHYEGCHIWIEDIPVGPEWGSFLFLSTVIALFFTIIALFLLRTFQGIIGRKQWKSNYVSYFVFLGLCLIIFLAGVFRWNDPLINVGGFRSAESASIINLPSQIPNDKCVASASPLLTETKHP